MRITTFAAIYVGSYEVSLKITEISAKRKIREIDLIRSRIGIGRNIYKHKKVETEVMEELCEILSEYEEIMKSYRVDAYRVYAGAFLKDAGNVLFVLEQIRIRTGKQSKFIIMWDREKITARKEKIFLPGNCWQKPDFWWILICWLQLRLREYGTLLYIEDLGLQ